MTEEDAARSTRDRQTPAQGIRASGSALESELQAERARLALVLKASGLGTWELDLRTGASARRSARHDQIFGYETPLSDWSRETFFEHVHPEDREHVDRTFREAVEAGADWEFECRIRTSAGTLRWIWVRGMTQHGPDGSPERLMGVVDDITERKQAEQTLRESERRFRLMTDAVPQIIWITDAEGRVLFFNQKWTDYTGRQYEPTTAAEVAATAVHPEDGALTVERFEEARRSGRTFLVEHRIRSASGKYRWFLVRAEPYRDPVSGEIERWFGASIDIHDRKLAEAALREAKEMAEQASRSKSEFLAVMSHELRTPLNAIAGYADLLEMGIHGPVTEAQRKALGRIQTSQQHLLGLINDVLNYARLESGAVTYEIADVSLGEVLASTEVLVEPQAQARGLTMEACECDPSLAVRADSEKLRQILLNLVSNSVKFTAPGGRIGIDYEVADDWIDLRVRDTGIGIPADRLESIFEPFVQVRADLTRTAEGTGLGLAISRDLARGMGGDLTVESTPGEGSVFTVRLRRSGAEPAPDARR